MVKINDARVRSEMLIRSRLILLTFLSSLCRRRLAPYGSSSLRMSRGLTRWGKSKWKTRSTWPPADLAFNSLLAHNRHPYRLWAVSVPTSTSYASRTLAGGSRSNDSGSKRVFPASNGAASKTLIVKPEALAAKVLMAFRSIRSRTCGEP